jgi:restriction endonuclease Mrr
MKNKDQQLLEEAYCKILAEAESILQSSPEESSNVDVKKVVHDIMNDILPHVFELDSETYKEALIVLVDRLNSLIQQN